MPCGNVARGELCLHSGLLFPRMQLFVLWCCVSMYMCCPPFCGFQILNFEGHICPEFLHELSKIVNQVK